MSAPPGPARKHRRHVAEMVLFLLVALPMIGVDLMFYFWPFRYREVHPLIEQTFASTVVVSRFHRTYFPHPGFVADGVTFYRHGDTRVPPLATVEHMRVVGTWSSLIFHPHTLFQIWLLGLHVRIPPRAAATRPRSPQQPQGDPPKASRRQKLVIETIIADATTLDFLRPDRPPLRLQFQTLQIHNVRANQPLRFFTKVIIPGLSGFLDANGSLGPLQPQSYSLSRVSGSYSLVHADLSRIPGISGHLAARGTYSGLLSAVTVQGAAAIPDFRAGHAHTVRLDACYRVIVNGSNNDIRIQNAKIRSGPDVIHATGRVSGNPKTVDLTIASSRSPVHHFLEMIEASSPRIEGLASFQAHAEFSQGSGKFLRRLNLTGAISLSQIHFVAPQTQQKIDAFSARVRRVPARDSENDPSPVTAIASSRTTFHDGIALFPNIRISLPGAQASLHGTFNLIDTRIHFTGKLTLQRGVFRAVTGWKSWLLLPLSPFFRHRNAGAIVPVAVTGTAEDPKIGQDLLHDK